MLQSLMESFLYNEVIDKQLKGHSKNQTMKSFGATDDMAVAKISVSEDAKIKSAFKDVEMISTPVDEDITSVKVVNEQQTMAINGQPAYEVWLTRAIIFEVGGREISFEKDTVPFSEEIWLIKSLIMTIFWKNGTKSILRRIKEKLL